MYIVAIHKLQGETQDLAQKLAQVMGVTAYEARARVSVPGGGPAVITNFAANDKAAECVSRLQEAGFTPLLIDAEQIESDLNRLIVSKINFATESLEVVCQDDQMLSLPYADIRLLLRGAGILTTTELETSTKKKFALGRAVATGGLMMRKKVTTVTANTTQDRQPFCHLYAQGWPPIVLRQAAIDYSPLGANRQLSRDANFTWICSELRRRSGAAQWDDRLQTRPGLAQVLGPTFDPECHLDIAIALVSQSLLLD